MVALYPQALSKFLLETGIDHSFKHVFKHFGFAVLGFCLNPYLPGLGSQTECMWSGNLLLLYPYVSLNFRFRWPPSILPTSAHPYVMSLTFSCLPQSWHATALGSISAPGLMWSWIPKEDGKESQERRKGRWSTKAGTTLNVICWWWKPIRKHSWSSHQWASLLDNA